MCRDRAATRPQDSGFDHRLPGLLRSPFATQGRSHKVSELVEIEHYLVAHRVGLA